MPNTIGYFEIQFSDVSRERTFYENVFGWKFFKEEMFPIEYCRIETDSMNGGLLARPVNVPPPMSGTNAFTCSVEVDNFDAISELVLKNGGQVAMAKFAVPGRCWQGYFLDADRNVF